METAVSVTRAPLPPLPAPGKAALAPHRASAAISFSPTTFGGGGGGGLFSAGGGRGGDDDSGAGAIAAAAALAALIETEEVETDDPDAIVLHVGGMSCGGCAGKVKQILESQPEVTAATIDFEKALAFVWTTPEARAVKDWKKELGEKLADHLSTCGFESHLQVLADKGEATETDASAMSNEYS